MTAPKALILDVEGVIAYPDLERADAELDHLVPGLSWQRLHAARNLPAPYDDWLAYSVGGLAPHEYWRRVLEAAHAPTDATTVESLQLTMRAVWWGQLDNEVLRVAAAVRRAGVLVGLLSNSAPEHEGRCRELESRVDVAHFSHRTGRRKPDAVAYSAVAEALATAPNGCIFVDDKLRNVAAAQTVGMAAFRFTDATGLAEHLANAGVPIARADVTNAHGPAAASSGDGQPTMGY